MLSLIDLSPINNFVEKELALLKNKTSSKRMKIKKKIAIEHVVEFVKSEIYLLFKGKSKIGNLKCTGNEKNAKSA